VAGRRKAIASPQGLSAPELLVARWIGIDIGLGAQGEEEVGGRKRTSVFSMPKEIAGGLRWLSLVAVSGMLAAAPGIGPQIPAMLVRQWPGLFSDESAVIPPEGLNRHAGCAINSSARSSRDCAGAGWLGVGSTGDRVQSPHPLVSHL